MATVEAHVPTAPAPAPPPPPLHQVVEAPHDVVKEKYSVIDPHPPQALEKLDESKAPPPADTKTPHPAVKRVSLGPTDRDVGLAHVEKEKSLSFIKAWEESEKAKVDNKAQKKLADVSSWENTKKAAIEAKLKKLEEELEKKKADYAEKMQNKVALIHKEAEERRAMVEARKGEEMLKAEEMAAKYRATGTVPKKLGFFGC